MNGERMKNRLLKLYSSAVGLLSGAWIWLRTQILPWAKQHPVVCTVVIMTVFYLWLSLRAEQRREFRNWPTNQEVNRIVAEGRQNPGNAVPEDEQNNHHEKPILPEDPEERATLLGWDPNNEDTPAKYKLPAKLSDKQTRRLIADLYCVSKFYQTRAELHDSYSRIYDHLMLSQDVIYERIETQKGFRYPELSYRWYEFISAGKSENVFTMSFMWASTGYVTGRVSQIRFRIIGGRHTVGDVKFVAEAIQNVINEYQQYEPRTRRAMQIRDWIVNERLLVSPYDPVLRDNEIARMRNLMETPLDKHPELQVYVNEIYRTYHGDDGTPPQISP